MSKTMSDQTVALLDCCIGQDQFRELHRLRLVAVLAIARSLSGGEIDQAIKEIREFNPEV